jgi:hypothetical protein
MRLREITEAVGRITKQNQTSDVGPQEIKTQAAKFGNTVDKDGRPPTLSKKTKGSKTNVLFNLGLTESRNLDLYQEAVGEIADNTEIFVDMDGVLADFFSAWANLMGVDNWRDINKKHNIDDALEKIRQTDDFWINLPLTSNAKQLLGLIKQVKGKYKILSSPLPGDKNSEPHKRLWVEKHLGFFPPEAVVIEHDKAKYAAQPEGTPNILIDDYGVNIQKWEAAGGIGFKHKDHKFERTAKNIKQRVDQPIEESFDTTADWTYAQGPDGSAIYAAKVDDAYIEITYKPTVNTENGVIISFTRDGDAGVTGKGSENKVFGAVINHIKNWVNIREPDVIIFTARKPADETGATDSSRSQLYKRMVKRFASQAGYDYDVDSASKEDTFYLEKQNDSDVEENFADGKKKGKSRPGRAKRAGVDCSKSITALRKQAKNSSGEKQKMAHWCANMKSGRQK